MCQRAAAVPSYGSLPGSVGDRIRSAMWFGGGSASASPGSGRSDGKVACCERCSATLVALKKQALSLAVHHHFSCKDSSDLSAYLNDNLRVHSRFSPADSRDREREQQGQCAACGTNMNLLKREAVHLALSRGQPLAKPPFAPSLSTGTLPGPSETKRWDRARREADAAALQPPTRTCSPHTPQSPRTPQRTPQTLRRRGPKLPNPDMDRWVEQQQQQQQFAGCKSVSNTDGVTIYPYNQAADGANLASGDAGTLQTSSKIPHISRVVTIANTAAMSFLARAAEKLSLTLRKKGQASDPAPAHFSTCFRDIIQKNPPPVPSCLLQAATRTKDSPNVGKVKVIVRVSPILSGGRGQPPVLQIDPSKKRVTIIEPVSRGQPSTAMIRGRGDTNLLRTFNFDAAYPQESGQAEVCAGVLADVIRCVLSGSDGCVLGLGCADVGSWSSTVGSDESIQNLGLIPCAISWLYSAIERRREKTWTDLIVSVSAVELCSGDEDTLRDLLGEVVPSVGNAQDSPRARIKLQEDPVYGIQLRNHNRVKAPTAERAASLLDAAIAARRHSDFITYLSHTSIMFFTLHVQPPRTDNSTIGKGSRGPTKLTIIDVCSGMRSMSKNKPPHSELGPVVLSLLSGHKTTPNKGSKLTMLLRESLGHTNCHTTVMAEVDDSLAHLQETLSTIQLASRIRRTQKRTKQSTSCSPCGRSLTREKKGPLSFSLRAFHSTDEADLDDPEFTSLLQELLRIPQHQGEKKEETVQEHVEMLKADMKPPERDCLKCETFAELQERLGCIDGKAGKQTNSKSSEAPQTLNQGLGCSQACDGEKQTDGDSFQREDSGLYDCEECSGTSSSEELLNQTLSLNMTCRSELPNTGTLKSNDKLPSQHCNVDAQDVDCDLDGGKVKESPFVSDTNKGVKSGPQLKRNTVESPEDWNTLEKRSGAFASETHVKKHDEIATPKVRRLSAPSVKNLSLTHKGIRQSTNRSASLSPDNKTVSFEQTSSFFSSSPPRSFQSISRTPSQSSTCSSTKSAIQGFVNGRISDLLKERASSPTLGGVDQMTTLPSPYSQMTDPRTPDHLSGHASDTTSVLSGDLPPAMGKTSLYFSNRNSMVSSGYDSMVRDCETTGSSASNRDSVSDRSSSHLSVARSCRSSRRKGSTGTHQRCPSQETAVSLRRSASGLRSHWADRGIPEAYEIKVYEIDNVQRMQKRAGAGKQGPACFSAKLKFLEHRQQRISEVRAKYDNLSRELKRAKHNLTLEPGKWNQEFDLWQTFEVDSLEHLEALEVVTARLENRVDRCKANVMMVTCFDVATRRRHKKRRRKAQERRAFEGT
ncbi:hypothetical protein F2P81_023770 [Scophthalmus maximus]|uniref:Kinesin motor domain-containing protein n=1 Tax=Scophthalmus maximus TaxID=52904 RepID=A0A6A4RUU4_SCOMX|nr:hypothetical protein F2P81_023770 [Scophthalmus maximus]